MLQPSLLSDTFGFNQEHCNRGADADLQDGVEDRVGEARTNHFRQPIPPDDGDQLMLAQVVADEVVQDLPIVRFSSILGNQKDPSIFLPKLYFISLLGKPDNSRLTKITTCLNLKL